MAKNKLHIDDFFKRGLKGAEQPLNGSEWNRLMEELHPPKKRRPLWLWVTLPLLLMAGGFALLQPNMQFDDLTNQKTPATKNDNTTSLKTVTEPTEELVQIEPIPSETTEVKAPAKTSSGASGNSANSTDPAPRLKKAKTPISFERPTSDSNRVKFSDKLVKLMPRPLTNIGRGIQMLIPSILQAVTHPKHRHPEIDDAVRPYYIGFTASGIQFNQNISGGTDYMRYRGLNESPQIKPSFGFEIGKDWKGLDVQTGLEYLEKGQTASRSQTYQLYDSIPYIDQFGNITWLPFNHRDTVVLSQSNNPTYRFINVPFAVGKSFDLGNDWGFDVGAKGNLHVLLQAQGSGLSGNLRLTQVRTSQYDRLNLSLGGYVGIRRDLNQQSTLALRFNWSNDVNNMLNTNDQKQRFTGYGIGVSLRHKLY